MSDFQAMQPGEGNIAKRIQERRRRIQSHTKADNDRAATLKHIKAVYQEDSHRELLDGLLKKGRGFIDYHVKVAKDGVAARKTGDKYENGMDVIENVFLSKDERCSHLDKAAGLEELLNYIDRQLLAEAPMPEVPTTQSVEKPETVVDSEEPAA
jgi:hypothetical protein